MATNADPVVDDDKQVTEEDLRDLKYPKDEVETSKEEDETSEGDESQEESEEAAEEDGQTDDQATEEEEPESPEFVKEFDYIKGDTPQEYAKNLEQAYKNSTAEALRLKREAEAPPTTPPTPESEEESEVTFTNPLELYAKQKMDQEITEAFQVFRKTYPQVSEPAEYAKFTAEVATFSRTILDSQKRLAPPGELYNKAAISLGWATDSTPDGKDRLNMALKDGAATNKTPAAPGKNQKTRSKVTEAMLKVNRMMYPGKTDQEIIEELTPYIP